MKKKRADKNKPVGKLAPIKDFLPPPNELILPEETSKVTIALSKSSIEFFKRQAQRQRTKYQKMIREVLDRYVSHYQKSA
jgi:predicted DNA binding CopG/RHH family protein